MDLLGKDRAILVILVIIIAYAYYNFTSWVKTSPTAQSVGDILGTAAKVIQWASKNPLLAIILSILAAGLIGFTRAAWRRFLNRVEEVGAKQALTPESTKVAVNTLAEQAKLESRAETGATESAGIEADAKLTQQKIAQDQASAVKGGSATEEDVRDANDAAKDAIDKFPPDSGVPSVVPEVE